MFATIVAMVVSIKLPCLVDRCFHCFFLSIFGMKFITLVKAKMGFQTTTVNKHPYFSAMAAILRDRINDLLTANADLEREVAKLRYADAGEHFSIQGRAFLAQMCYALIIKSENAQLRHFGIPIEWDVKKLSLTLNDILIFTLSRSPPLLSWCFYYYNNLLTPFL